MHPRLFKLPPLLCAAALLCGACAGTQGAPLRAPLTELPRLPALAPEATDRAARNITLALWQNDADAVTAHTTGIQQMARNNDEQAARARRLLPFALDARNSLLANTDATQWHEAQRQLLARPNLSAALRARIEAELAAAPLAQAEARTREARRRRWGGYANTLSQSIGSGVANPPLLPLRIAQALVRLGLRAHAGEALSTPERQALQQWKRFARENPEAAQAEEIFARIEAAQARWLETMRDQNMRAARRALQAGDSPLAAAFAQRALRYLPEDSEAQTLAAKADARTKYWAEQRARSLQAAPQLADATYAPARALAAVLWREPAAAAAAAEALLAAEPEGALADEAQFVLAQHEGEDAGWAALAKLARAGPEANMARHARALHSSLHANPYGGFLAARAAESGDRMRWLFFGPLARGARERDLPRPVEWLVEIPSAAAVVGGLPQRLLSFPFMGPARKSPGVLARRYLARHPQGAHARELQRWLFNDAKKRGNEFGAWQIAQAAPSLFSAKTIDETREAAAQQAFDFAQKERRRMVRVQLLRAAARAFPQSEGGRAAGRALRELLANYSPQRIRVTRGFLREHPQLAGPAGLGLQAALLDGETANGELHKEGIAFLGERVLEFSFVAESGDESAEPRRVRERVSAERLQRAVAQLEESAQAQLRRDPDERFEADAARDTYFERARLGAVERADMRPRAGSTYTYMSAREKFGAVRGRESVLPVELVLQGSFSDFSLGAFPRVRLPRPTPDAVLYR